MSKRSEVATVLVVAVAFCFSLVSMVEAKGPIWQIYKDGTNRSIPWKTHAGNPRFAKWKAGTNGDPSDDLVLDRETGLVWERQPDTTERNWFNACGYCYNKAVGDLKGWRPPTIEELASLVDSDNRPALPTGSPFINVQQDWYWSSTTYPGTTSNAWLFHFGDLGLGYGAKTGTQYVWCVQGGQGHDSY